MFSDQALRHLARALARLRRPHAAAAPWAALRDLAAIGATRAGLTLDLRATTELGVPLLIAHALPPRLRGGARLTRRETQVVDLLRAGQSNKAIARQLRIAVSTAKDHVHNILEKTGAPSRAALIAALAGQPRARKSRSDRG